MMSRNISNIAIFNIECADYCCIVSSIIKSEAVKLMQNINLTEKSETLLEIIKCSHIKWVKKF